MVRLRTGPSRGRYLTSFASQFATIAVFVLVIASICISLIWNTEFQMSAFFVNPLAPLEHRPLVLPPRGQGDGAVVGAAQKPLVFPIGLSGQSGHLTRIFGPIEWPDWQGLDSIGVKASGL